MSNDVGIAALAYQLPQTVIVALLVAFLVGLHRPFIATAPSYWQAVSSLPGFSEMAKFDWFCQELVRKSP